VFLKFQNGSNDLRRRRRRRQKGKKHQSKFYVTQENE